MSRELRTFQDAVLVRNVIARVSAEIESMEFPNEEALKKYLEAHPKADKSKHTVKKDKGEGEVSNPSGGAGVWKALSTDVEKAKERRKKTDAVHNQLKKMQEHFYSDNPADQKKYQKAYDDLYKQGEDAASDAKKLIAKVENYVHADTQQAHALTLLQSAVNAWDRNRVDHLKTNRQSHGHLMGLQAEQTWGYATKIDDHIDMLDRAMKGEYDQ